MEVGALLTASEAEGRLAREEIDPRVGREKPVGDAGLRMMSVISSSVMGRFSPALCARMCLSNGQLVAGWTHQALV